MGTSFLLFSPSLIHCRFQKENFLISFLFFADPPFLSYFGLDWWFHRVCGMLQGGSLAASPLALRRPLKLLVEEAVQEELDEQEAAMEKLEVEDVEFEKGHMEVV